MDNKMKTKMRELGIFKNSVVLNDSNGKLVLHQDDMPSYNTWFLIEHHCVDSVLYRGDVSNVPKDIPNLTDALSKLNNPKNVIVTFSTKDTY